MGVPYSLKPLEANGAKIEYSGLELVILCTTNTVLRFVALFHVYLRYAE